MDLRVSVVLLFIFLTGGYSLKCYSCLPDSTGSCKAKVETCPVGHSKCGRSVVEQTVGSSKVSFITKVCADKCVPGTHQIDEGTLSLHCCDTDLCNAADGVYKGSFLLLFSPLLFYFLFQ
ncbi:long neurotoxin homolog TA-bm16-like isoform X2 [Ctenopharyngodon idella]|uniref:long neurotoxin homolog TA-bm16-like isoform X1 n=1 Tax=Ctenopharyngodon idella TaxID=7959 RepID=UPI002232345B|nr:long neurotoxin homolog TA-bm16-like isoform X1 [Ctenopharyngodon idella]XP_051733865.1 long neurotoxin homolog TA-bm16-like isoform X2 [Ctenopharyngodon idella]